jgi:Holliday junction resolvase RusA-like endonuclease
MLSKKEALFCAEIPGRVGIKKNSRRLAVIRGRPMSFASSKYLAWERVALSCLKQTKTRRSSILMGGLHASYTFHFKNRASEPDVSNCIEGIQDCLQAAAIIENDKQIVSLDAQKLFTGVEKTIVELYAAEAQP